MIQGEQRYWGWRALMAWLQQRTVNTVCRLNGSLLIHFVLMYCKTTCFNLKMKFQEIWYTNYW